MIVWLRRGRFLLFLFAQGFALTQSSPASQPPIFCEQTSKYRQFDFWVGEWAVTTEGKVIAQSSIQKLVGSCVIYENYSQADGYSGKSFNVYDSFLKNWRQTWVDSSGNVSEFTGELKDGTLHYAGESHRQNGNKILRKNGRISIGPGQSAAILGVLRI